MTVATKQAGHFTSIDDFARSLEPRARRAFLDAIERLKGRVDLAELEAAIASRSFLQVQDALGIDRLADELAPFRDVILDAFRGGGQIAAAAVAPVVEAQVGVAIAFDITDDRALRYIQEHSGRLITGITEETRRGIVLVIEQGFREGFTPTEMARRFRDRIGLTAQQEIFAQNYERTLRAAVRGEATWADVARYRLNPIQGPGGLVEARVDAAVARYRARSLAQRAQTIAENETFEAASAGRRELWRQLVERGALPATQVREWLTARDEKVCPICKPMQGERAPIDGSYRDGLEPGRAHVGCRCDERLIFEDGEG